MKKQGFTLIELMVVIVIMGILAAVAVPKLFGMIAKSKASEVPTAAGTWISMQEAYLQEKTDVGDWLQIGYEAPGSKTNASSYTSSVFTYTGTANTADWKAAIKSNGTALNSCTVDNSHFWGLTASKKASDGTLQITDASSHADCLALTPSWSALIR